MKLTNELRQNIDKYFENSSAETSKEHGIKEIMSEVIFRARSKDTGNWIEGNYHHNIRKGEMHTIARKETNIAIEVYRESLQLKDSDGEFKDI